MNAKAGGSKSRYSTQQIADDVSDLARIARKIAAEGRETFFDRDAGEILRKAARQIVTDLATAVSRLDDSVTRSHPEVPWRDINDTRNYVAHAYDHINDDIIWAAIDGDIDQVAAALSEYRSSR